jgi:hypothetical protein
VLAGMVMRRSTLLLGGTGAFVLEVLAKALHFLIEQELSMAQWGMLAGGLLILIAAAFESRKLRFVQERLDQVRLRANRYLAALK